MKRKEIFSGRNLMMVVAVMVIFGIYCHTNPTFAATYGLKIILGMMWFACAWVCLGVDELKHAIIMLGIMTGTYAGIASAIFR